mmetsp:Transcript_76951/g.220377  ORF Transcript_76951/g.220377 Transcript_76951/m.220377 type:complete len:265 (-) Transcript_76951:61-855(-)
MARPPRRPPSAPAPRAAASSGIKGLLRCRHRRLLCPGAVAAVLLGTLGGALAFAAAAARRSWGGRALPHLSGVAPISGLLSAPASASASAARRGHSLPLAAATQRAPPEVEALVGEGAGKDWVECLLEYEDRPASQAAEVWVFRKRTRGEFERLMHMRINGGYPPGGEGQDRPVDYSAAGISVACRERAVDADLTCAECVRVLTGGAYGNGGISVPAYPPKPNILDCLDLSRSIAVEQGKRENGSPLITQLTETAFCNSVRLRG